MMYIGFKVISGYSGGDCCLPTVMTASNRKIRRWKKKKNRCNNIPNLHYEWRCMKDMPTLKGLDISPISIAYDGIY